MLLVRTVLLCFIMLSVAAVWPSEAHASQPTIEDVVAATWPANERYTASQIAGAESNGYAYAYNESSGTYCLFQFAPITMYELGITYEELSNPYTCSAWAAYLQDLYGWAPWVTYPGALYMPYQGDTPITYGY